MERKNSEEDSLSAGHNLPRIVYQEGVNSGQIPFLIKLKGENLCALLESRFSFTQEQIRGLAITISPEIKEVREEFQEKLILGETALRRNPQGIRETTLYAGSLARFHAGQKSEVAEMDSEQIILARTQRLFSLTLLHEARHAYDLDLIEQEEKKSLLNFRIWKIARKKKQIILHPNGQKSLKLPKTRLFKPSLKYFVR